MLALVVAAGVGLLIAVVALLNSSLALITDKTNEIDTRRGYEAVQAAVDASSTSLAAMIADNSVWNGASTEIYGRGIENAWLYSTWGVVADDAHPYDGTFILDENFRILWGCQQAQRITETDSAIFGTGFAALVKAHGHDLSAGGPAMSGLTRTRNGAAVIAIGLIRPSEGAFPGRGATRRYLVMTRHLTPVMLQKISTTFRINDLTLAAAGAHLSPGIALKGADGRSVGQLTWKLPLPGAQAAQAAAPGIQRLTAIAGVLILLFVLVSAYALYRLAQSEKLARTFAQTDGLSGLPNRRALFERLQKAGRLAGPVRKTVVFIDLDGFKEVNDIYGHATGDKLIMIVAAALKGFLPENGMLARIGGDEFAVLVGGADGAAKCDLFAQSALAYLTAPIRIGERTLQIGASIGIASGDIKICRSQELFRRADMAMYHSKSNGKGRITYYDADLDAARLRKQTIEAEMREGLARDEFDVAYQPIVDSRTGTIVAVEALVRWPRRPAGPLFPDQFIDIAEASGLIHALGKFVLRRACSDLRDHSDLCLSVNISPAQFRDPDFEGKVAAILAETDFPVERLELEVTEGYLIENPDRAIAAVANLKALGVSMSLDDFGTGYSSIGYLRRYAFDKIKIDKSLAGRVDLDPQAAALVAGTVSIANALGLSVTAEGVETEDHVRLLKLAGCHYLQGYYFSRPKPLGEILALCGQRAVA